MSVISPEATSVSRSKLRDRIQPRLAIEAEFTRLGHTYRHGPMHRFFDHQVQRPVLKLGLSMLGLYERGKQNALRPIVREMRLEFANLPPSFDGYRLMHMSDFHVDGVDGLAEALSEKLKTVEVDVCLFSGDYRFEDRGPCDEVYPLMRQVVDSIRSRHGIYAILGNHDPGELVFPFDEMGINMLVNDSACLREKGDEIWLVGLDDNFDYNCHDLPLALENVPQEAFKILLVHAPELYEEAERHGVSFSLSGHTHGGQLRLPKIGALKQNARCPKEYAWGHWRHGRLQGYTSCGVGCSTLPIRFNCPPEIMIFELRCAP